MGAKAGTLSIMCGGSDAAMQKVLPLLELMGTPRRMGGELAKLKVPVPKRLSVGITKAIENVTKARRPLCTHACMRAAMACRAYMHAGGCI